MNAPLITNPVIDPQLLAAGTQVLEREGVYLDEQRWDEWLALFVPDCEYWVPSWKNEETLTTNPQAELSHIYYASRAGLEDRVVRIRSRRSPASTPMPRTTHVLSNVMALDNASPDKLRLRSSWVCHVFFPRMHESHAFFGRAEYELVQKDGAWLIGKKKTILQNDYIPTMLDVYCI
jgi:3-phenylpropionate/cinnamic acid dioxygenase small subunit